MKYKLWVAYFLLSVIPALFVFYLAKQSINHWVTPNGFRLLAMLLGLGALIIMSLSAFIMLYRSASMIEDVTRKVIGFARENVRIKIKLDTKEEAESLDSCFTEMVKEIQYKTNEVNKYAVSIGEASKSLSQMAVKDGLTQLYNDIYIKERLDNEIKRANQFDQPLSVIMLDIDDFKKYNDFYGHLAGDICLREISRIIRNGVRDIDIPARYSVEEFIVILPGAKSSEAFQVAEKIRQKVFGNPFPIGASSKTETLNGKGVSLTISAGVASCYHDSGIKTAEELIKAADKALFQQAKKNGKNQVALYV
jgi:diguanylate cyclase (GGDEF)-like protein